MTENFIVGFNLSKEAQFCGIPTPIGAPVVSAHAAANDNSVLAGSNVSPAWHQPDGSIIIVSAILKRETAGSGKFNVLFHYAHIDAGQTTSIPNLEISGKVNMGDPIPVNQAVAFDAQVSCGGQTVVSRVSMFILKPGPIEGPSITPARK